MEGLFLEVFLIAILVLLNGYLAGTEIAVVTTLNNHMRATAGGGCSVGR